MKNIVKFFILFFLAILSYWLFLNPIGISKKTAELDKFLKETLPGYKIDPSDLVKETREIKKIRFRQVETISKTYLVLPDFPFDSFRSNLAKKLSNKKFYILSWEKNIKERTYRLEIGFKGIKIYTLILKAIKKEITKISPPVRKGKVAIVIDDFGYNIKNIDNWLSFKRPITFSILPNLNYSRQIAELANIAGKEIILHLPLEPKNEENESLEESTILTTMSRKEILSILDNAIKSVPYLRGVSNHQGSLATEDKRLMEIILNELKKRGLYFLDSLVTDHSVCREVASQINLRFAQRDVFLDNENDVEYIKTQLYKLAQIAQRKGFAVGIGHVHTKVLEALEELYPILEERGIEFVYLSDLVK